MECCACNFKDVMYFGVHDREDPLKPNINIDVLCYFVMLISNFGRLQCPLRFVEVLRDFLQRHREPTDIDERTFVLLCDKNKYNDERVGQCLIGTTRILEDFG